MDGALHGGNMNAVTRIGDTVSRVAGPWTSTIHRYLTHLGEHGIDWIPRPVGIDGDRETLSFVEGDVPLYPLPEWVWTDSNLAAAGRYLRALHDASLSFDRTDASWQWPAGSPDEVICHNDFAPHNLVFRDGQVAGAIDFDLCAPGSRVSDLANLATRMIPLTTEHHAGAVEESGWKRRADILLDAYGSSIEWDDLLAAAVVRLHEEESFTRAKAIELGKPQLVEDAELYRRDAAHLSRLTYL